MHVCLCAYVCVCACMCACVCSSFNELNPFESCLYFSVPFTFGRSWWDGKCCSYFWVKNATTLPILFRKVLSNQRAGNQKIEQTEWERDWTNTILGQIWSFVHSQVNRKIWNAKSNSESQNLERAVITRKCQSCDFQIEWEVSAWSFGLSVQILGQKKTRSQWLC